MTPTEGEQRRTCCTPFTASIELIFFLFKVGESMLDPSVRLFLYQGICLRHYSNDTSCYQLEDFPEHERVVQAQSAAHIMYYKLLLNVPAAFLGLFCGAWSDRVGRKLPILLAPCGNVLAVMCLMLSITLEGTDTFVPVVLFSAAIRGAFGKSAVMTMAVHSYVSDISDRADRTRRIGKLLSMNFFGYFVGSLTAGALLSVSSFDVVFCTIVFTNCMCVIVTVLFVKETIPFALQHKSEGQGTGDFDRLAEDIPKSPNKFLFHWRNIGDSLNVLVRPREGRGRMHLLIFFFVILAQQLCKSGETDTTMLFVEKSPLSWKKSMYGYLLAVDYASLGLAVFLLLPLLLKFFHLEDLVLIMIALLFKVLRLMILAFSTRTWMVFLSVTLGCPSAMIISGSKSLISKGVNEDELGKAFSLLSCGETIANLLGTIIFTSLYSVTFTVFGGLTFTVDAVFHGMVFFGLLAFWGRIKSQSKSDSTASILGQDGPYYGATSEEFVQRGAVHTSREELVSSEETFNTPSQPNSVTGTHQDRHQSHY